MNVLFVAPGKKPRVMEVSAGLTAMQTLVGGPIQAVYPFDDPLALVCHEEGKLIGLEPNRAMRSEDGEIYDIICGPFFLCGLGDEEFISLPQEYCEKYAAYFEHPEMFLRVGGTLLAIPY